MVEVQTHTKNMQETPNGAPYVYFDKKYTSLLGMEPREPVEIQYDFNKQEIRVHKKPSSLSSALGGNTL